MRLYISSLIFIMPQGHIQTSFHRSERHFVQDHNERRRKRKEKKQHERKENPFIHYELYCSYDSYIAAIN